MLSMLRARVDVCVCVAHCMQPRGAESTRALVAFSGGGAGAGCGGVAYAFGG